MNNKLEDLSKKLVIKIEEEKKAEKSRKEYNESEIERRKAEKKRKANIESEAVAAGVWGAIKYAIGYGFIGFLLAALFEILGWEILKWITFYGSFIVGAFIGYSDESHKKRNG